MPDNRRDGDRRRRSHGGLGGSPPQSDWFKALLSAADIRDNDILATLYRIGAEMRRAFIEGRPPGLLRVGPDRAMSLTSKGRADRAIALLRRLPEQVPGLSVTEDASPWQDFGQRPADLLRIDWTKVAELLTTGTQGRARAGAEEKRLEEKRSEEKRRDPSHFRAPQSAPPARDQDGPKPIREVFQATGLHAPQEEWRPLSEEEKAAVRAESAKSREKIRQIRTRRAAEQKP